MDPMDFKTNNTSMDYKTNNTSMEQARYIADRAPKKKAHFIGLLLTDGLSDREGWGSFFQGRGGEHTAYIS